MSFAVFGAATAATLHSRAGRVLEEGRFESLTALDCITTPIGGVVGMLLVTADGTASNWAKALTVLAFLTSVLSVWSALARGTFKVVASALVLLASLSLAVAVPIIQLRDMAGQWMPSLIVGPVLLTVALFLLARSMVLAYWGGRGRSETPPDGTAIVQSMKRSRRPEPDSADPSMRATRVVRPGSVE